MADAPQLTVDVVSDSVCPWCYIGAKRLEAALALVPDIEVETRWRPYQLDPSIPPEGTDRKAYMMCKFGDEQRLRAIHDRVIEIGRAAGIKFNFDAIEVAPNTLDAHRVIRWAASAGPGIQDRVARRIFALYFEQGADIGKMDVLTEAARDAGMDPALVESLLASDADTDAVRTEIETASRMGISGVPCFLIEGKYAVMGAQEADALADAIRKVSEAKQSGLLDSSDG